MRFLELLKDGRIPTLTLLTTGHCPCHQYPLWRALYSLTNEFNLNSFVFRQGYQKPYCLHKQKQSCCLMDSDLMIHVLESNCRDIIAVCNNHMRPGHKHTSVPFNSSFYAHLTNLLDSTQNNFEHSGTATLRGVTTVFTSFRSDCSAIQFVNEFPSEESRREMQRALDGDEATQA